MITVTGFNNSTYYIDNDIVVTMQHSSILPTAINYFLIKISSGSRTETLRISPDNNKFAKVNLSPLIKSMFKYPAYVHNEAQNLVNINSFNFEFTANTNRGIETEIFNNKYFVRGGEISNNTNVSPTLGILKDSDKVPYWNGYGVVSQSLVNGWRLSSRRKYLK